MKSPLTNALLILDALALPSLHILLAQPAIEGGDFACLQHGSPPFRRQASMVMYCYHFTTNLRPCQLKNSLFVKYSVLFQVFFDKFPDFSVQAVSRPVAGRSTDKIGRFADLMFRCGDFNPIFRQRCSPFPKRRARPAGGRNMERVSCSSRWGRFISSRREWRG